MTTYAANIIITYIVFFFTTSGAVERTYEYATKAEAEKVADQLRTCGFAIRSIEPVEDLEPADKEDYERLVERVLADGGDPEDIIPFVKIV